MEISPAVIRASFKAGLERYALEVQHVQLEDLYVSSASEHSPYTNNNYVNYKVVVKTKAGEQWAVERRYNDFNELKEMLQTGGVEIRCVFPGKSLFNKRESVIRERIAGFTVFLRQVVKAQTHRRSVLHAWALPLALRSECVLAGA